MYCFHRHSVEAAAAAEDHPNKSVLSLEDNRFEAPPSVDNNDKKRKKKRNGSAYLGKIIDETDDSVGFARHPFTPIDPKPLPNHILLRDRYNDDLLDDCPILNAIDKRCQSVDLISGTGSYAEILLTACGVHQFCYLCVS